MSIVRSAPALIALALLASPAIAQDSTPTDEEQFSCVFTDCDSAPTTEDASWDAPASKGFDFTGPARDRARARARTQQAETAQQSSAGRTRVNVPASDSANRSSLRRPNRTRPTPSATTNRNVTNNNCVSSVPASVAGERRGGLALTFNVGSFQLTSRSQACATAFASAIRNDPNLAMARFRIEGHTDSSGGRDANLILSQRRAEAVVNFLVSRGVPAERLVAEGKAFDSPIDPRRPEEARNRRVEAVLLAQ